MAIIISGFGHILVARNEQIVLLLAVLWIAARAGRACENWLRNRYEWSRDLWRPIRRWYAVGRVISGVDGLDYFVLDYDTDPEQTWVRVAVHDEADESPSQWEPIDRFVQPVRYTRRVPSRISTPQLRHITVVLVAANTVTMLATIGGWLGVWGFTDMWQFKAPYYVLLVGGGISAMAYFRRTRRDREASR